MIGVDRMDQLTSYYSFLHKSVKWWRKVFFWVVELAMVNSFILHKKIQKSAELPSMSHVNFRREILLDLCRPLSQQPKPSKRLSDHSLERLQNTPHYSKKMTKRRDCRVCSSREDGAERNTTQYVCITCTDTPSLCPGDCDRIYHTQKNYRQ